MSFSTRPAFFLLALPLACTASGGESERPVPPPMDVVDGSAYEAALRIELPAAVPADDHGLHNVYRLSERIVSGGEPQGEEALRELRRMGIRTVVSVDGKVPDAKLAARYGLRYVHIPIQYRGIRPDEMARLAKTFRELPAPFYVHCFHGKHRGPAAAAVGRLVLDGVSREEALAEMRQWCGTSPSYEGLYRAIAEDEIPGPEETRAYAFDFPAAHPFAGFRKGMVEVARSADHLKALAKRDWRPDPEHPDVDAVNEAEKLAGVLRRCAESEEAADRPEDFRAWMEEGVQAAEGLRASLAALARGESSAEEAADLHRRLSASCKSCHAVYRND